MSTIVPSNHRPTRTGAWVNSKMSGRNPLIVYCAVFLVSLHGDYVSLYTITVGFSPVLYCRPNVTTMHDGNPFKYHEEVSYLQLMVPPPFDVRPNVTN